MFLMINLNLKAHVIMKRRQKKDIGAIGYSSYRFSSNIKMITGRPVGKLLRITLCLVVTVFLLIVFFVTISMYQSPDYGDGYVYPPYAIGIGFVFSTLPFIPMVLIMFYEIYKAKGSLKQRIEHLLKPRSNWQPADPEAQEIYYLIPYVYKDSLKKRIYTKSHHHS